MGSHGEALDGTASSSRERTVGQTQKAKTRIPAVLGLTETGEDAAKGARPDLEKA